MIKTKTWIFCDACGKDITDEYQGSFNILIRDDMQEVETEERCYCKECMISFREWEKGRAGKNKACAEGENT